MNCPPRGDPNAKICGATGTCVECATNTDCPTGEVCEPGNHTCHASCTGAGAMMCGGDTPICDMTTGACVGCESAMNCTTMARPICSTTTQQCVECAASTDCANNMTDKVCDTTTGDCVQCMTATDCPTARPVCSNGHVCEAGCMNNMQCADETGGTLPVCDTTTGECEAAAVTMCNTDTDCSADGGGATPYCTGMNGHCVECITMADCPANARECFNNVCR